MKKIKIGVLIPYSGIFKNLRSDFCNAMELAIPEVMRSNILVIPEFVHTGGTKQVKDVLNRFTQFEAVDLVTGILGNGVLPSILSDLDQDKVPVLINNLGGYVPSAAIQSPYLFYNSLQLWKSEWAIGNWSRLTYGGQPSINTAMYDGGYHLKDAFRLGTVKAGADTCNIHTLKGYETLADTAPLIEIMKSEKPGHAHILLSGTEGEQFLNLFYTDKNMAAQPITFNPFMVEDGMKVSNLPVEGAYSAMTWSRDLQLTANIKFVTAYKNTYGEWPNAFSLLGYETGLAIAAAIANLGAGIPNRANLAESLRAVQVNGPRGSVNLSNAHQKNNPVYLRLAKKDQTGLITNEIIKELTALEGDDESLASFGATTSGWQNPYLCV